MMAFRSCLFYFGYVLATVLWGGLSVLIAWVLPYRTRFSFIIGCWTRFSLWWLKVTCGIRYEVSGLEHVPADPCVVLCRHESTWETLFLQTLFAPQATLIKRELLRIPFFGWAFALLRPIAIDRRSPRDALKKLIRSGRERLESGIWVVLFPEGTRMAPEQLGRFQAGGAALATATGSPLLVVAHNAGQHWPAHRFMKRPGTIQVRIGAPLAANGEDSKVLTEQSRALMHELLEEINPALIRPD